MLKPMADHPKNGESVLARFRKDLFKVRHDLDRIAGRWVVVRHEGVKSDGWDGGWNLAGPFGYGGIPDDWFIGWQELPTDDSVAIVAEPKPTN